MATKTISLELDAYERLKAQKRGPRDSFSAVVRRAVWPGSRTTGPEVLAVLKSRSWQVSEDGLQAIEEAERSDTPPSDPWEEGNAR